MKRYRAIAILAVAAAIFAGCHAAGGLFTPPDAGTPAADSAPKTPITGQPEAPAQTIIREAAESTGIPWVALAGSLASTILGAFLGKRGARAESESIVKDAVASKDAEEWTAEDVQSIAAALRAHGFKIERA